MSTASNLRQAHWGLFSQGANTGTNFLLTLLVARAADPAGFGAFAVVMVLYTIAVGVVRAGANDVLAVTHTGDPAALRARAGEAVTFAAGVGVLAGLCCAGISMAVGPAAGPAALVGALIPPLLVQEALRGLALARGEPREAALSDGLWAVVQLTGVSVAALAGGVTTTAAILAWGAGGCVAAAIGLVRFRVRPARIAPHLWFVRHRAVAWPLLVSHLLTDLPLNMSFLLMPLVAGLAEVGALRAAFLFFGPLGVLILGARSMLLPDAARLTSATAVRRLVGRVTVALALVAAAWGLVVVLLPDPLGTWLIGENWAGTSGPRVFLATGLVAEAVLVGAITAYATLGSLRRVVRIQVVMAPVTLGLVLVAAALYGATGAAAALASGYTVTAVAAWFALPSGDPPHRTFGSQSHRTESGSA